MHYCGLDFGTSNSTIGIERDQQLHMVPLDAEKTALRSAVFINDEERGINYGKQAIANYTLGMEGRLLMSLKSVLGSSLMQEKTVVFNKMEPFTAILAHFINHVKSKAEQFANHALDSVVMGRPVYFKDNNPELDKLAQDTLENILRGVGFKNIQFQFEPIAASAFYKQQITQEELVLIIDLGGGTSDFSLVRMNPRNTASFDDILATDGIHIGGNDFDKLLNYDKVSPYLGRGTYMKALNGSDIEIPTHWYHDLATWHKINFLYKNETLLDVRNLLNAAYDKDKLQKLLLVLKERLGHHIAESVEDCKIQLSASESANIDLDFLENDLLIAVNKADFQDLLHYEITKLERVIQNLLTTAGVHFEDINTVFFTGGSSKIAVIQTRLMALFQNAKKMEGDYFNSVGMGLAIEAQACFR